MTFPDAPISLLLSLGAGSRPLDDNSSFSSGAYALTARHQVAAEGTHQRVREWLKEIDPQTQYVRMNFAAKDVPIDASKWSRRREYRIVELSQFCRLCSLFLSLSVTLCLSVSLSLCRSLSHALSLETNEMLASLESATTVDVAINATGNAWQNMIDNLKAN